MVEQQASCTSSWAKVHAVFLGYMPEWILLEKQVREDVDEARIHLKRLFKAIASEGSPSLDERRADLTGNTQWEGALAKFRANIAEVNLTINKLNLVVPMLWRQQVFD